MPFGGIATAAGEGLAGYVRYLRLLLQKQMQEKQTADEQNQWLSRTQTIEDYRRGAEDRERVERREREREERERELTDPLKTAQRTHALRELDPAYQAARSRMQNYWPRFSRAQLQASPDLLKQFLADNTLLGSAIPTTTTPETKEVRTPGMPTTLTPPPSLSDRLRDVAQTIPGREVVQQVPTGKDLTLPILPDAPTKRVVFVNQQGQVVQDVTLPEGTEIKTLTPPTPKDPARFIITDSRGNVVRELEAPPGTQMRVLPAPPQPRAGGKVSGEGLTAAEQRLVSNYNRLIDQRDRLTGMLTQNPLGDKDPLKARIDAQMAEVDAQIARLRPQVDQIFYGKTAPAKTGTADFTANVVESAKRGKTWAEVVLALKEEGVNDPAPYRVTYDANVTKPNTPPSAPIVEGLRDLVSPAGPPPVPVGPRAVGPQAQADPQTIQTAARLAKSYKAQGMTWTEARRALMRNLVGKKVPIKDAMKIADAQAKAAFDQAPARR